jgi:hypothetical protein
MPCPYFLPTVRTEAELWPHRRRLPLGDGWEGRCACGDTPTGDQLSGCNMGYAQCANLPQDREADAVRFKIQGEQDGCIHVFYICERAHHPGAHGTLEFDRKNRTCASPHANPCIQRLAECFLQTWMERR